MFHRFASSTRGHPGHTLQRSRTSRVSRTVHVLHAGPVLRLALTMTLATALALGMLGAPSAARAQDADPMTLELGRDLTQQFYQGRTEEIGERFNEEMSQAIGGAAGLSTFRDQIREQLGEEVEVLKERTASVGENRVYNRSARFANFGGVVAVVWSFDAEDRVVGFFVQPEQAAKEPAPSPFLDYETRAELRLPFDDEWTVVWGGRTVAENFHAAYADQRFAYDLLVVEDGRSHRSEGHRNEDYHCFGLPILAPAAGVVVQATDGLPDNTPGELESAHPPGNHVVIDHGNDEYSFLAHLREGTVRVSEGQSVVAGDGLGECGNSGRSSEPHLHYHMQNTPEFGGGEGLPAPFRDYVADDTPVRHGEPVQGQRIRPGVRDTR